MADDRLKSAIDAVARHFVQRAVEDAIDFDYLPWENYPELGEHDWERVTEKAKVIAKQQAPDGEFYKAAYEFLAQRAEGVEA